ncbi:MAG: hypothetical protein AABY27_07065, partial [Pseudomonadota bacterium]
KEKEDPYLYELRAQYYFENGKFLQAIDNYNKALSFIPKDKIIKVELAAAQINEAKNKQDSIMLNSAISTLNQVVSTQNDNIMAYFMLSRAYGKLENQRKAIVSLADYYFYLGAYKKSNILANKVLKMSSPGSREYIRASDIVNLTNDIKNGERDW